jgi:hypothetical protein
MSFALANTPNLTILEAVHPEEAIGVVAVAKIFGPSLNARLGLSSLDCSGFGRPFELHGGCVLATATADCPTVTVFAVICWRTVWSVSGLHAANSILFEDREVEDVNPFLPPSAIHPPFSHKCMNKAMVVRLDPFEVPNIARG